MEKPRTLAERSWKAGWHNGVARIVGAGAVAPVALVARAVAVLVDVDGVTGPVPLHIAGYAMFVEIGVVFVVVVVVVVVFVVGIVRTGGPVLAYCDAPN